jgi:hypothetical protein
VYIANKFIGENNNEKDKIWFNILKITEIYSILFQFTFLDICYVLCKRKTICVSLDSYIGEDCL